METPGNVKCIDRITMAQDMQQKVLKSAEPGNTIIGVIRMKFGVRLILCLMLNGIIAKHDFQISTDHMICRWKCNATKYFYVNDLAFIHVLCGHFHDNGAWSRVLGDSDHVQTVHKVRHIVAYIDHLNLHLSFSCRSHHHIHCISTTTIHHLYHHHLHQPTLPLPTINTTSTTTHCH